MQSHCGQWVQIRTTILPPDARAEAIPAETREVPLEMRIKGWQVSPETATTGDTVEVRSTLGRHYRGQLEAINPPYGHDFGAAIPELLEAGEQARAILSQGKEAT
ncbi:2-amino-4-oxopentanoate thiolase subunit OrtA [Billgrantia kenyensis]|uniref:2-amino-4-ketopentanoate thiolase n=1 Tax=Billgrantia kenyensis TaxID=321266 RepID=A0A7W0ACP5_9GAMM|nr:2-amino-4-oxopentanoate thiolase subunit OrtA [Halomonas kenyensis]MBA2778431.1 2-amino-4-ketopentanoate thiolase [Halomonas kenyensis]MCG6660737.1 2-amino-4-ketopentanoate thiolase [Halomonas kenyensis]